MATGSYGPNFNLINTLFNVKCRWVWNEIHNLFGVEITCIAIHCFHSYSVNKSNRCTIVLLFIFFSPISSNYVRTPSKALIPVWTQGCMNHKPWVQSAIADYPYSPFTTVRGSKIIHFSEKPTSCYIPLAFFANTQV